MSDKLVRAKHTHEAVERMTGLSAEKAGSEATTIEPAKPSVASSAALISFFTIISRITGFARTWTMAITLGVTALASSYVIAYNIPFMLSELVAGGMISTAFLPVYISVKRKLGKDASNNYASNLLTIVVILLGIMSILSICFPSVAIKTQSLLSDQGQSELQQAAFFFQIFAIQIVFYGVSAIFSGLLNANRDYLWYSIAPIFTNLIHIGSFVAFGMLYPEHPEVALYVIAIANPVGVAIQIVIQMPALKRHGIRLRPRVDLRSPEIRETFKIGVPAVVVVACSFVIVSVQQSAALSITTDGPSAIYYARLWFTLPYSFLAVPIATAMFTELSALQAEHDIETFKKGVLSGASQTLFFMIPFALYLFVFSVPLITLYGAGNFTQDDIPLVAGYLAALAFALPFYGINTYMERVFASMRKMNIFAAFNVIAMLVQVGLTLGAGIIEAPLETIAYATLAFYALADILLFAYLKVGLAPFSLKSVGVSFLRALVVGLVGAGCGAGALWMLQALFVPLSSSGPLIAVTYIVVGGSASLVATYGLALAFNFPEAKVLRTLGNKIKVKLNRRPKKA